jgi:hypothetical protein
MNEPTKTDDVVPFDTFWANLGANVPPAFTVIVPAMTILRTAAVEPAVVASAVASVEFAIVVAVENVAFQLSVVAVAVPPFRSTLTPPAAPAVVRRMISNG